MPRTAILSLIASALALLAGPPATAEADWDQQNAAPSGEIEGYFSEDSALPGDTLHLHVSTKPAASYRVELYRLGWWTGAGPDRLACVPADCTSSNAGVARTVPAPDSSTGRLDAGWPVTDTFVVPAGWRSGYYVARLVLTSGADAGKVAFVPIVLRAPPGGHSAILVQAATNTWQAYNTWGGKSLYPGDSTNSVPANRVSFNRPYWDAHFGGQSLWDWELQLARFLEREGYDVSYTTGLDVTNDPGQLLDHRLVISAGHDEYWTHAQEQAFSDARDHGVNLAFLGGNDLYWQIRYEDGGRTIVGYKDSAPDPITDPFLRTVQFQTLGRPECRIIGVNGKGGLGKDFNDYEVNPDAAGNPWFAGTGWHGGDLLRGLVHYEWDTVQPNCAIAGSTSTPLTVLFHWTGTNGRANADATVYSAPSGARVFSASSISFSWGLDGYGTGGAYVDPRVQQFMHNVLDDLTGAPRPPGLTTGAASSIGTAGATLGGVVNPQGRATTYAFDYGTTSAYGTTTASQSAGSGTTDIAATQAVAGLQPGTIYHYRLVATSSAGTRNGAERTFTTRYPAGTYPALVVDDGPAGYWRLGEASGATANDATGADPGTYGGGVTPGVPGAVPGDTAAAFDGTGRITVPNSAPLNTADTFTFEAWVRPASVASLQGISGKASAWSITLNAGGLLALRGPTGTVIATAKTAIADTSAWHHVAVTKAGASVHLYLDGADVTGAVTNATLPVSTGALTLGGGFADYHGALDEPALYPRALTEAAVLAHAAAGPSTGAQAPSAVTGDASSLTATGATLGGTVDPRGSATTYVFEYGATTGYGSTTTSHSAGSGSGGQAASAAIGGLRPATTYHYRLVAASSAGTARGADATLTTPSSSPPIGLGYAGAVEADAPVSYWRLGELSGATAKDAMGVNPGSYAGGVTHGAAGAIGGDTATSFDGSTGQVNVPDSPSLDMGDTFTLEAWVKPARLGATEGIVAKGSSSMFFLNAADQLELYKPNAAPIVIATAAIKDTTTWHHVAVAKDGASVHLYLDGKDVSGPVTNLSLASSASPLTIGAGAARFRGAIDEVAVYAQYLGPAAIAAHYAAAHADPGGGGAVGQAPAATTGQATQIGQTTATLGGTVNPGGQATTYQFEYGTGTTYGSATASQSAGSGTAAQNVSAILSGLAAGTTYHYRLVATNATGTARGADATFTTASTPPPGGGYAGAVEADGPVSYWRLGELSGTAAADQTGADPGSYAGGVTKGIAGAVGDDTAVSFDGSTGQVTVPDATSLDTGDAFTLEAWVKPARLGVTEGIAIKQGAWMAFLNAANRLVLYKPNVGQIAVSTAAITDTTTWHHVAVTKSGSSVHLYLDGADVTGAVSNLAVANTALPFLIGTGAARFKGGIDEVALYPRALPASAIAAHVANR